MIVPLGENGYIRTGQRVALYAKHGEFGWKLFTPMIVTSSTISSGTWTYCLDSEFNWNFATNPTINLRGMDYVKSNGVRTRIVKI